MAVETYALKGGDSGRERLRVLSRVLRPQMLDLFRKAGLQEGMACLDIGCGGGDATFDMARMTGARGRAVGIDLDDEKLALARREAQSLGLTNVEFAQADAMAEAASNGAFDFVYARQLLCHVEEPARVIGQMIEFAAPGAVIAAEDIDFSGYFCHPPCPELHRYMDLVRAVMRARGGDADIGPKLPGLFGEAGLAGIEMKVAQPAATTGEIKMIQPLTMAIVTDAVVADGLCDAAEVERITETLLAFAEDPSTVMSVPRFVQVWGRKPRPV